jgi:cytochrome c oxidase subunit 4
MADHAHAVQAGAAAHAGSHPSNLGYVKVFFVLLAFTVLEVGALYVPALKGTAVLPIILLGLAAIKFATVVAFYMHLKFDHWLFTAFFAGGMALAISLALALMTLFGTWWQAPASHGAPEIEHGTAQPEGR